MIKRLKWNVLYGGGDGVDSDGGLSSSSEEEAEGDEDLATRQAQANAILQELVERDPDMAETLHAKLQAMQDSSDEGDDDDEQVVGKRRRARNQRLGKRKGRSADRYASSSSDQGEDEGGEDGSAEENGDEGNDQDIVDEIEAGSEAEDQRYAEWKECELCPGSRLLTEKQVEEHVKSRKHQLKVEKYEQRQRRKAEEKRQGNEAHDTGTGERAEVDKTTSGALRKEKESAEAIRADSQLAAKSGKEAEDKLRREEKRKAKVKRRLKLMKMRKWKKMQSSKSEATNDEDGRRHCELQAQVPAESTNGGGQDLSKSNIASRHRSGQVGADSKKKENESQKASSRREKEIESQIARRDLKKHEGEGNYQTNNYDSKRRRVSEKMIAHSGGTQDVPESRADQSALNCGQDTTRGGPRKSKNLGDMPRKKTRGEMKSLERKARKKKVKTKDLPAASGLVCQ